jgi:hypothetical protein
MPFYRYGSAYGSPFHDFSILFFAFDLVVTVSVIGGTYFVSEWLIRREARKK